MDFELSETFSIDSDINNETEYTDDITIVGNIRYFTDFKINCDIIKFSIPECNSNVSKLFINEIAIKDMLPFKCYVIAIHGQLKDVYDCIIRLNDTVYFYTLLMNYTCSKNKIEVKIIYNLSKNKYRKFINSRELSPVTEAINHCNLCSNNLTSNINYNYCIDTTRNNEFVHDLVMVINRLIDFQNPSEILPLIESISNSEYLKDYLLKSYKDYKELESKFISKI